MHGAVIGWLLILSDVQRGSGLVFPAECRACGCPFPCAFLASASAPETRSSFGYPGRIEKSSPARRSTPHFTLFFFFAPSIIFALRVSTPTSPALLFVTPNSDPRSHIQALRPPPPYYTVRAFIIFIARVHLFSSIAKSRRIPHTSTLAARRYNQLL